MTSGAKSGVWFDAARFGLFVHFGHASQRGLELSWPLVGGLAALPHCQDVPADEYHATARTFAPSPGRAREWARLARRLGMRYAVLTAKHHDGFALFHTRLSDFSVEHTPYRADLVREFVDAVRDEGLRVGLYFSLSDWHRPDYPPFTDADRPYSFGLRPRPSPAQWARYVEFMHGQVRELLTNYGTIDVLWFDGGWERSAEEWRSRELETMIRTLQPAILVNDRLPGGGDFDTPEQLVPAEPPARRWETCMTINGSWGWNPTDRDYKSGRRLVHTLCEVAAKGGNLLLNIGPTADGSIPSEIVDRLAVVERWMTANAESIVETEPGLAPWQAYAPSTRRGDRIYVHLLMRPYETVTIRAVPIRRVRGVHVLATGTPLRWRAHAGALDTLFNTDPLGEIDVEIPDAAIDAIATVLAIDVASAD